jgi:hypothetical protein
MAHVSSAFSVGRSHATDCFVAATIDLLGEALILDWVRRATKGGAAGSPLGMAAASIPHCGRRRGKVNSRGDLVGNAFQKGPLYSAES